MDITLNNTEIETAIREYIGNQGIDIKNKTIEVSFTAGRGANGSSASVTLLPAKLPVDDNVKNTPKTDVKPKEVEKKPTKVKEVLEEEVSELKEQLPEQTEEDVFQTPSEEEDVITEETTTESLFGE